MSKKVAAICPCGTGRLYTECCNPYIERQLPAPTPEALMRSRYTAYTKSKIDYIAFTQKGEAAKHFDRKSAQKWAQSARWYRLSVIDSAENENQGRVHFKAYFYDKHQLQCHAENSAFEKEGDQWYYVGEFKETV